MNRPFSMNSGKAPGERREITFLILITALVGCAIACLILITALVGRGARAEVNPVDILVLFRTGRPLPGWKVITVSMNPTFVKREEGYGFYGKASRIYQSLSAKAK